MELFIDFVENLFVVLCYYVHTNKFIFLLQAKSLVTVKLTAIFL